jgi:hypothetical protein
MVVREVDERDGQWEDNALGYRVVFLREHGVHWHTYDVESESLTSVEKWATEQSAGSDFSIAVRVAADGGVGLIWLTPPPESFYDDIRK